eukprot:c13462_g2_i1 orf=122-289(+)
MERDRKDSFNPHLGERPASRELLFQSGKDSMDLCSAHCILNQDGFHKSLGHLLLS